MTGGSCAPVILVGAVDERSAADCARLRRRMRACWWQGSPSAAREREGGVSRMATTRDQLRKLLDELPDDRLDEARLALALLNVPDDDEPITAEELEAIARSHENFRLGK